MPPHFIDGEPHAHPTGRVATAQRRRAAAHRHRRPGRLRQDRTGRRAVPAAARRAVAGGADQRHLHHRGRRLPAPPRGAARRPDRRGADRRLPAHRDPRRHHRQPRRHRRPDRRASTALDLILVESGGDNLTATFSSGLVDVQIFVVDVAGGDKVPRKGGPGVTYSDLLVVNKTDLAPLVGADLGRDAPRRRRRARRPPDGVDLADRRPVRRTGARRGCASSCGSRRRSRCIPTS